MRAPLLAAAALILLVAAVPRPKTTSSGIYSAAQAEQGARLYADKCAMCHGSRLEGGVETPPLTGKFMANWAGASVGDLVEYVSKAMPQPAPASLSSEDNLKLVAFLLRQNGAPPGSAALSDDGATYRSIRIVPSRPQ
jgi:cytochrome c